MLELAGFFFICAVLAVLEISLSFDNTDRQREQAEGHDTGLAASLTTWGIVIAVFSMCIVFPLAIVAIAANIGPIAAMTLPSTGPQITPRVMNDAHVNIARPLAAPFLLMVGLSFFFDKGKDIRWVRWIEDRLARVAGIKGVEVFFVLIVMVIFSRCRAAVQADLHLVGDLRPR